MKCIQEVLQPWLQDWNFTIWFRKSYKKVHPSNGIKTRLKAPWILTRLIVHRRNSGISKVFYMEKVSSLTFWSSANIIITIIMTGLNSRPSKKVCWSQENDSKYILTQYTEYHIETISMLCSIIPLTFFPVTCLEMY